MKRRDFLFLAHAGDGCVRLSCEQLYMHYSDLEGASPGDSSTLPDGAEWWAGEPESEIALESPEQFFQRLRETLRGKRRLELTDPEWLADGRLQQEVEQLLSGFSEAGGEIVYPARIESAEVTT